MVLAILKTNYVSAHMQEYIIIHCKYEVTGRRVGLHACQASKFLYHF